MHLLENAHSRFPSRGLVEWTVQILPFLEQDALFRQYDLTILPFQDPNAALGEEQLAVYLCPTDPAPLSVGPLNW